MGANLQPENTTLFGNVSTSTGSVSTPTQSPGHGGRESGSEEKGLFDDEVCTQLYLESHAASTLR